MKCNVCGHEFEPKKENRYLASKTDWKLIGGEQTWDYECFDCPVCGCQIVAQERFRECTVLCGCGTAKNDD